MVRTRARTGARARDPVSPGSESLAPEETTPRDLLAFFEDDPASVIHRRESLGLWGHLRGRARVRAPALSASR